MGSSKATSSCEVREPKVFLIYKKSVHSLPIPTLLMVAEERRQEKLAQRDSSKGVKYMPQKAKQWSAAKDKETLRRKRRDERANRKEYKKKQKLEQQAAAKEAVTPTPVEAS